MSFSIYLIANLKIETKYFASIYRVMIVDAD
jgi:hypothetical protein